MVVGKGFMVPAVPEEVALEVAVVEGGWMAKGVAVKVQEVRRGSLRRRVFSATVTFEIGDQLSGSVQMPRHRAILGNKLSQYDGKVTLSGNPGGGHSSRWGRSPGHSV